MFQFACLVSLLFIHASITANQIIHKLDQKMKSSNSLVCVGLDPDLSKIPNEITALNLKEEDKIFEFLKEVIDLTVHDACAFKIQKAFFDGYDCGHQLLKETIQYIHEQYPQMPVLIDCKIGDIENTMDAYMENLFGNLKGDGVVINPYMGDDVFAPFLNDPNKLGVVLVQTSNPKASVIQNLVLENGEHLWERVLKILLEQWNKNKNLIPVLSSNSHAVDYCKVRKIIPDEMPILLAGVGSQGGNPEILRQMLNKQKRGVFVNSSRGILYPYHPKDLNWKDKIRDAILSLKNQLNSIRYQNQGKRNFLLICGPSGVGKSSIIQELKKMDPRFEYVTPLTSRPLRENETDKISVTVDELLRLQQEDQLLALNECYGTYYGTPKYKVNEILSNDCFAVLDWPIEKLDVIKKEFPEGCYVVYVFPENEQVLSDRLERDLRDESGIRYSSGIKELKNFEKGFYDQSIHLKVMNQQGALKETAKKIYHAFLSTD
jgi:orotidine-5'-phosphate decarboxylase